MQAPAVRNLREEWALAFVLMGGRGRRPSLTEAGLVAHRADGSTLSVGGEPAAMTLRGASGEPIATEPAPARGGTELVEAAERLMARHPEAEPPDDGLVAHFPPRDESARIVLALAYAAYRPELDALAEEGIDAYLEDDGSGLRIFGDLSPTRLLDVSLDDAGLPPLGPGAGDWAVFLTTPDGRECELTVPRGSGREADARALAAAVAGAVA